jgi:hypothetical protein
MKSEMEDQGLGVDAGVTGPGSSVVVRVPYIIDLPHEGFNPSITRWRGGKDGFRRGFGWGS